MGVDLITLAFIFLTILAVPLLLQVAFFLLTKKQVSDVVTGKERHEGFYVIYCEDEVYTNKDNWVFNKFNSSNMQANIKSGRTYIFTVVGLRIPFVSNYKNIIKYEEVT